MKTFRSIFLNEANIGPGTMQGNPYGLATSTKPTTPTTNTISLKDLASKKYTLSEIEQDPSSKALIDAIKNICGGVITAETPYKGGNIANGFNKIASAADQLSSLVQWR
jgi:hypothetical protein